jgi:hypothetical protein
MPLTVMEVVEAFVEPVVSNATLSEGCGVVPTYSR